MMSSNGHTPVHGLLALVTETLRGLQQESQGSWPQGLLARQTQEATLARLMETLTRHHMEFQTALRRLYAAVGGLAALGGLLLGLGGWARPAPAPSQAAWVAVERVLAQHWGTLPPALQDQLSAAYRAGGVPAPAGRP
jgi:hypothetical protein